MLETIDTDNFKSISNTKRVISKIIKKVRKTHKSNIIFNRNTPEAVIISTEDNNAMVSRLQQLEDQLFYTHISRIVKQDDGTRLKTEDVLETFDTNEFQNLYDEELFD